jgi:hypothetical protein
MYRARRNSSLSRHEHSAYFASSSSCYNNTSFMYSFVFSLPLLYFNTLHFDRIADSLLTLQTDPAIPLVFTQLLATVSLRSRQPITSWLFLLFGHLQSQAKLPSPLVSL